VKQEDEELTCYMCACERGGRERGGEKKKRERERREREKGALASSRPDPCRHPLARLADNRVPGPTRSGPTPPRIPSNSCAYCYMYPRLQGPCVCTAHNPTHTRWTHELRDAALIRRIHSVIKSTAWRRIYVTYL
jgi:hypothetical protein